MDNARARWPFDFAQGRRRIAPWLAAGVFYSVFAIVQTWPLVTKLSEVVASDPGDPLLNTWILWWNAHAVPLTTRWWDAPSFFPATGALAFSEVLLGLAPLTTPIQWLGHTPVAAYNIAFLVTFPLSALAAHALAYRLCGRHDAATIAGLVYGFAPYRVAHFPQIQILTSFWMPLGLLGLHEYLASKKRRWLALFALSWAMQALSNGYYLLFFPVLIGLWILWFAVSRSSLRTAIAIVIAWAIGSIPLVPLLWSYRRIHAGFGFNRDIGVVSSFSADFTSFLDSSSLLKFWHPQMFHRPEGELFPGYTALLLALVLLVMWLRTSPWTPRPRATALLIGGAVLYAAAASSVLVMGPWAIRLGKAVRVSVSEITTPLTVAALLFALALATLPRVHAAWRARSPHMFYVLAMGLLFFLSLGVRPKFLGVPVLASGPYRLLMMLPGFDSLRSPARFALLAILCLSFVAALSFARLTAALGRRGRLAAAALVLCGVIADSVIAEMPLGPLPLRLLNFESLPAGANVLELPLGGTDEDVVAMYRGMYHGRPVINGYSGYFPFSYAILKRGFELRDPRMFDALVAWGPLVVVVNSIQDGADQWARQLAARPGTMLLGEESGRKIFLLPGGPPPADPPRSARLPIRASANVNDDRMALALDGDRETRWDSGPQRGVEEVTVDLQATRFVDGVTMTINEHAWDFPKSLVIETSEDGRQWTSRWEGSTAAAALAAALRQPRDVPLVFAVGHVPARFLRMRQLGSDPIYYWSIFELAVYGD